MKKIIISCMLLLLCHSFQANAQLYGVNQTDYPVWIALAYNYIEDVESFQDTWVTEAWKYIPAKDTIILSDHIGYDSAMGIKTNFFFYAFQPTGMQKKWQGIRKFLLDDASPDPNAKDEYETAIRRAHKPSLRRKNPNYKIHHFKMGSLGDTSESTEDFIILRQSDVNDKPEKRSSSKVVSPGPAPAPTPAPNSSSDIGNN